MDRALIERKLDLLRGHLSRVRGKRPATAEALAKDADRQDIIVLNLSRAVQTCVDIGAHLLVDGQQQAPASMGETFERLAAAGFIDDELALRLRRAVGFRNIAVHAYEAIDWKLVHLLTGEPLADFDRFAAAVMRSLDR